MKKQLRIAVSDSYEGAALGVPLASSVSEYSISEKLLCGDTELAGFENRPPCDFSY